MKPLGIKYQILLITLIPVVLIDLAFSFRHVNSGIEQAQEQLRDKGQIIARQIAGASELNLYTGNHGQIRYLLDQAVGSNDVVLASVYDHQGRLISSTVSSDYRETDLAEYFYFRQPILSQSIAQTDLFQPQDDNNGQSQTLGWVHLYLSHERLEMVKRQIVFDSGLLFIAILLTAIVLIILVSRRVTRPIFNLIEHLKLVEKGQLGKTIEPVEAAEIGALQEGFNRMTRALMANRRHLNQRIQQATQQLNEAITDLESRNRELGFARDQAQDANRVKSRFLANMSHEIRTPINGIKGFISLLGQSKLDARQRRYVDIIQKSTLDLTNIVDEILEFSKMESGKLNIVEEEFDLHEVIEQTRDILFINVLTKNIDLNLIIFSDTPRRVFGDKLRLKQILLNLIGNAIKFTDHGEVVVRVSLLEQTDDRARIEISVRDSGIGISVEDQQNLFKAFSQVDNSGARRLSGTGLGLVISKNLATLMGGDIELNSTPGEGSEFVLELPFKLAQTPTVANAPYSGETQSLAALIFSATNTGLMEIRTLFDRAGVNTEVSLIDNRAGTEPVRECVQRNLAYIDLLVFDLRHLEISLDQVIARRNGDLPRVILMDYDQGVDLACNSDGVEFVSVITTSQSLAAIIARRDDHAGESGEKVATGLTNPKRVLLVDDNRVNLKLASELIRLWGHEVVEAEHGSEALRVYDDGDFDLIVLDIQMPDIDGASLLQMMRERKPGDRTPVVALTANILHDEAERLLDLGFDFFLGKPIDEEKFRALLDGSTGDDIIDKTEKISEVFTSDCVFDYAKSLALSADNESLLRQILEILQRDIPDHQQQLNDAQRAGDLNRLAAIAHKLHGVTCYASLPRLRGKVVAFQQQLSRNLGLPTEPLVTELVDELARVKQEVETLMAQMTDAERTA